MTDIDAVSWCRIFDTGPACARLCAECRGVNATFSRQERRAMVDDHRAWVDGETAETAETADA